MDCTENFVSLPIEKNAPFLSFIQTPNLLCLLFFKHTRSSPSRPLGRNCPASELANKSKSWLAIKFIVLAIKFVLLVIKSVCYEYFTPGVSSFRVFGVSVIFLGVV